MEPASAREQFKKLREKSGSAIANAPDDLTLTESRRFNSKPNLLYFW